MANPLAFEPDEDAVIRELFPDYAAILGKLPARSRQAIKRRASKLGVSRYRGTVFMMWKPEEDEIIHRHYPHYPAIYALLKNRTRDAIKRRAVDIGVTAGRCGGPKTDARPWTEEERALAERWGVQIPGRSRFALVSFRNRNAIKVRRNTKPEPKRREPPAPKPRLARKEQPTPAPKVILLRVPKPAAWKRKGNEISPRVIAAAARSKHGIELIAVVQRAVPRDVWPHLRPLVVEQVALGVVESRISASDIPAAVKDTVAALVAQQFSGAA